jgi:uncharacterized Zn-binding protein involved in type VI secretion
MLFVARRTAKAWLSYKRFRRSSMARRPSLDEPATPAPNAPPATPRGIVARFPLATIGSSTRLGGTVVPTVGGLGQDEYRLARVGDRVRYPDGSESLITSGAGQASTIGCYPVALVGSHVANGDRIVATLHSMGEIVVRAGDEPIPGFLEPGYVVPRGGSGASGKE